ncbi:MAG TPA: S41 family peptidase [Candidatus Eisenbacteria bacterium]
MTPGLRRVKFVRAGLLAGIVGLVALGLNGGTARAEPAPLPLGRVDLGATSIVFSSSGDLFVVERSGGEARPLTTGPAWDDLPLLSPDGSQLAFARSYDGDKDIYIMPMSGGEPVRLTWHPKGDFPRDWTIDGRSILFSSSREGDGVDRLYLVDAVGGNEQALDLPRGSQASYSPDGSRLAMTFRPKFDGWRRYRGGNVPRVHVVTLASGDVEPVPAESWADWQPMWINEAIWFLSERAGAGNLYRWRPGKGSPVPMTDAGRYGFESASAGPGGIVLVGHGRLWMYAFDASGTKAEAGSLTPLEVRLPANVLPNLAVTTESVTDFVQQYFVSPDGATLLVQARGDIFVVPGAGGAPVNVTDSPGVADRSPGLSPDGRTLAWLSDASGEYRLNLAAMAADGSLTRPAREITIGETPTFYTPPSWSPDGKYLVTADVHRRLWLVSVADGRALELDRSDYPGFDDFQPAWSPDGHRVAWVKHLPSRVRGVFMASVDGPGAGRRVTPVLQSCEFPVFSADGTRLYATTAPLGPAADTFGMVGRFYRTMMARSIVSIDPDGDPESMPSTLPVELRNWVSIGRTHDGQLVGVSESPSGNPIGGRPERSAWRIDTASGKTTRLATGINAWEFAAHGTAMLLLTGDTPSLASVDSAGSVPVSLDSLTARVDRRAEWRQIFHESVRFMRDWFYDPGHHGQDLVALEAEYARWLPTLRTRRDLDDLVRAMFAHVSVSHLGVGGGDDKPLGIPEGFQPPPPVGLAGVDVAIEGNRFRITRVFAGDGRSPLTTGPLAADAVRALPGEWLLSINGQRMDASRNFHAWFEMAGRAPVNVTLGPDSSGAESRTVPIRLLRGENTLRRIDWAEANRRRVMERSGGRLGYLYLPDTGTRGVELFHQMFYAQRDREGLIIDERFNSGGAPADLLIETLARRPLSAYLFRDGRDIPFPSGTMTGPMVMLINESAGSGGDTLPWMFRRAGLGPLVGMRTMGAGIGLFVDIPALIDGGELDIPTRGFYNPDGAWEIENGGVVPDREVDITPADWRAGRDPQLEAAIDDALSRLERPREPTRSPRGQLPPN